MTLVQGQGDRDEYVLLKTHQNILDSLLRNDVDRLFLDVAEDIFGIESGSIQWKEKSLAMEERRTLMEKYSFSVYEDIKPPLVKVSNDGSLAWLVASVRIEGQEKHVDGSILPVSMLAAWVELYEKGNGTWLFVGSVASANEKS